MSFLQSIVTATVTQPPGGTGPITPDDGEKSDGARAIGHAAVGVLAAFQL